MRAKAKPLGDDRQRSLQTAIKTSYDPAAARALQELIYLLQVNDENGVLYVLYELERHLDGRPPTRRIATLARRVRQEREHLNRLLVEPPRNEKTTMDELRRLIACQEM